VDSNLISKKKEYKSVSFSGNIYPATSFGRLLENLDYRVPYISMGIQHLRNILKGR